MTQKPDIIYILKNSWKTDPAELRCSLRSLENFTAGRVYFIGGQPPGFEPDGRLKFMQEGSSRFARVMDAIRRACELDELTPDVWLFNDDFFILRPAGCPFCYDRGQIAKHARDLYQRHGFHSAYEKTLTRTQEALEARGLPTKDYTLHLPMLINRADALEAIAEAPEAVGFRNWYGNFTRQDSLTMEDVKITDLYTKPGQEWTFCSTSDGAFKSGAAGAILERKFAKPSPWEVAP